MERQLLDPVRRTYGWRALVLSAMLMAPLAASAQQTDPSAPGHSAPVQEVQVTASKLPRKTLKHLAIRFVKSHGEATPAIHQVGSWQANVCPQVSGLSPAASAFVSHRVTDIARSVGAPTSQASGCGVNVVIVFTHEPQQLLDHMAADHPSMLGSNRSSGDTTFHRAVQSWYVTGTKAINGWNPPVNDEAAMAALQIAIDVSTPLHGIAPDGARVDPAYGDGNMTIGTSGDRLSAGIQSELLHVFIIVDSGKIAEDSLSSVSDYIAMLTLTRMKSLDGCSELPSIMDLLSSGCGPGPKPQALTETDTAYLKALYSSDLGMKLNLEQSEMRDRMVAAISGR